jgi:chemotaxis methyl-accepting protein methylase
MKIEKAIEIFKNEKDVLERILPELRKIDLESNDETYEHNKKRDEERLEALEMALVSLEQTKMIRDDKYWKKEETRSFFGGVLYGLVSVVLGTFFMLCIILALT